MNKMIKKFTATTNTRYLIKTKRMDGGFQDLDIRWKSFLPPTTWDL